MRSPFTNDHVRQLKFVKEAMFVGDGRRVLYLVTQIDEAAKSDIHSVWLYDRESSSTRRIGEELGDLTAPAVSPDGWTLAAIAEVDGTRQIVLVPLDGTATRTLTSLPQGVGGGPAWSPDGSAIAFTAGLEPRDPTLPYRVDRVTYRFDGLGYLDDVVQDIYVADVSSGAMRRLTEDRSMNSEPRWSPDGRSLAYLVSFPPERAWTWEPELNVVDVATGESRAVVSGWGGVFGATWAADGSLVFLGCAKDNGYMLTQKVDLWTIEAAGGTPRRRTDSLGPGLTARLQVDMPIYEEFDAPRICVGGGDAYVSGQLGGRIRIYRVALSGPESVDVALETDGSVVVFDVDDRNGELLYLSTSLLDPPELMLGSTRITSLNDDLIASVARPDVQRLDVTAADGVKTEAWALTPPGEKGPWPTVLAVHGGPYGAYGEAFMIDFELLVGAGFAVVLHNFRGSHGYGTEFSESIRHDWGTKGSLDHHAALDAAIDAGIADPDRLGVSGLSHGGFATCWLLGTSDRFKAGVAENPVTAWPATFGITDMEWFIVAEHGGTPWEVPDVYRDSAPLTYAPNCTTPLLFVIGEQDMRCHATEAEQYYRVLKTNGVPTEMLRMPGCSHMGSHTGPVPARLAQNEALVEWFKRHLAPEPAPTRQREAAVTA